MEFSRQEYWRGLPYSSPGDLPDLGIKPVSLGEGVWISGNWTNTYFLTCIVSLETVMAPVVVPFSLLMYYNEHIPKV